MTKVIAVANQKGGVGKTTTAVTLGHGLARAGKQVLIIDGDPQGQSASALGLPRDDGLYDWLVKEIPLQEAARSAVREGYERPGLFIVLGNKRTMTAQVTLTLNGAPLELLKTLLRGTRMDYVIFDTSPSVGFLQEMAMFASDWLITPTATEYLSSEGLNELLTTYRTVQSKGSKSVHLAVLPTMYDERTKESRATLEELQDHLKDKVLPPIHHTTLLKRCAAEGRTIWEVDPTSRAAQEYTVLVEKVLAHG